MIKDIQMLKRIRAAYTELEKTKRKGFHLETKSIKAAYIKLKQLIEAIPY